MELPLTILCTCGKMLEAKLCHLSRGIQIEVEICSDCLKRSETTNYKYGYDKGFEDAILKETDRKKMQTDRLYSIIK
jgi:hypothetical protein